jgi:hypothetical protein
VSRRGDLSHEEGSFLADHLDLLAVEAIEDPWVGEVLGPVGVGGECIDKGKIMLDKEVDEEVFVGGEHVTEIPQVAAMFQSEACQSPVEDDPLVLFLEGGFVDEGFIGQGIMPLLIGIEGRNVRIVV